jgi:predicted RNase H-like nuclease (RuvC/YqgF family)
VPDALRHAEIRELQAQIHRTESYADALRQQLQDARQDAERRGADHLQMEQALDNALEQMRELRAQLEDERLTKADIEQQKEALQRRYDGEIHGLRSELDEAQLAIADQRGTNEQLAAELLQSNDSGRALQDRLDDAERQLNKRQTEMQQQIGRQRQQIDELRDKIESKDKAISALLNELAHKSSAIDSLDEIGHAVHDLDDRMLASLDDRDIGDRERSTRLLVGTIDGQKLRFPLFKDRLTIGRGADNDIQLKTPCISRRHAVIVSDGRVCRIEDQGSRNGVYVNGTRTLDAVLANGDELVIGTAVLTFEERSKH